MDGQQTLDGGETTDPRVERAAKALMWADFKRSFGQDGHEATVNRAKQCWSTVEGHYLAEARVALGAAGVL
jgi:hypothetical protein